MGRISNDTIATSDGTGTVRIWDTSSWTIRTTRQFDGLEGFAAIDSDHLLVEVKTEAGDSRVSSVIVWDFRTNRISSGPFPTSVPHHWNASAPTAVLPGRGWATTDGGTQIIVRNIEGTVLRTIDPPLQAAQLSRWSHFDSYRSCGGSAIVALSPDALLLLGARQSDGALIVLRCDVKTGDCRELFAETSEAGEYISMEDMPLHPHGVMLRLPARDGEVRALFVPSEPNQSPTTLIMPRGREREGFDRTDESDLRGAVLLQDGRIATWGWWYDHAIRLWTPDGVTAGAMGTVSRFWTRDPLESTLFGDPE
jgi:WD40 repeat protein